MLSHGSFSEVMSPVKPELIAQTGESYEVLLQAISTRGVGHLPGGILSKILDPIDIITPMATEHAQECMLYDRGRPIIHLSKKLTTMTADKKSANKYKDNFHFDNFETEAMMLAIECYSNQSGSNTSF